MYRFHITHKDTTTSNMAIDKPVKCECGRMIHANRKIGPVFMLVALISVLAPHDDDGVRFCCPTADVLARVAGAHSICLFFDCGLFT